MTYFSVFLLLAAQQESPVEQWIQQLVHDELGVRQEAVYRLVELGKPALPLLREAARKGEAELRERALDVLNTIDHRLLNGRELWSRREGQVWPLVHESGKIYFFVRKLERPKPEQKVVCLDAETGHEEWSTTLYEDLRDCDASFVRLSVQGGFVFFSDVDGTFCLDAKSGKTIYSVAVGRWRSHKTLFGANVALVARPDKENNREGLSAYDLGSGRPLWDRTTTRPEGSIHPLASFKKLFLIWDGNHVSALDQETGRPLWDHEATVDDLRFRSSFNKSGWETNLSKCLLADDSSLYLSSAQVVTQWDAQGRAAWTAKVPERLKLLGQDRKRLYGATHSGQMAALSKADGSQVWITAPPAPRKDGDVEEIVLSTALVDNRLLVLMRPRGRLRDEQTVVRGYDPETGKPLWTAPAGPYASQLPQGGFKGSIYIVGEPRILRHERLCKIDLATGNAVLLDRPAPPRTPLLVGDTLYCAYDQEVIAVRLLD